MPPVITCTIEKCYPFIAKHYRGYSTQESPPI